MKMTKEALLICPNWTKGKRIKIIIRKSFFEHMFVDFNGEAPPLMK